MVKQRRLHKARVIMNEAHFRCSGMQFFEGEGSHGGYVAADGVCRYVEGGEVVEVERAFFCAACYCDYAGEMSVR